MTKLGILAAGGIAAGLGAACGGGSAFSPELDAACTAAQQDNVHLEDGMRVADVFITREYTVTDIRDNTTVHTTDYRVCQTYTCRVVRPNTSDPLGDAERADALAACRAEADHAWATRQPL
jgi:hypothetical protein